MTNDLIERLQPNENGLVEKKRVEETYKKVLAQNLTNISFPSVDQHMKQLEERYTFNNSIIHISQLTDWIYCIAPFVKRLSNASKMMSRTTICVHHNPCPAERPPDAEIAIAILKALNVSTSSSISSFVDEISVTKPTTMTTPLGISIVSNLHFIPRTIKYEWTKLNSRVEDVTSGLGPLIVSIVKLGIPRSTQTTQYDDEHEELRLLKDELQKLIEEVSIRGVNMEVRNNTLQHINIQLIRHPLDSRQPADLDIVRALLGEQLEKLSKMKVKLPALPKMDFTGVSFSLLCTF